MMCRTVDVDPTAFEAISSGAKTHELVEENGVPFQPGDEIVFRNRDNGEEILRSVPYATWSGNPCALSDFGLRPGFAIVSLAVPVPSKR